MKMELKMKMEIKVYLELFLLYSKSKIVHCVLSYAFCETKISTNDFLKTFYVGRKKRKKNSGRKKRKKGPAVFQPDGFSVFRFLS